MDFEPVEGERSSAAFEGRRQVDVPRDYTPIEQRVHAVSDIVLRDGRWVRERIISEVLWKDALGLIDHSILPLADAELLELYIADTTLASAIFELVGFC
mgnify:CR=1 FL=1